MRKIVFLALLAIPFADIIYKKAVSLLGNANTLKQRILQKKSIKRWLR